MKVLHINTHTSGGAAISAIRLHKALLSEGIDSSFLSLHALSGITNNIGYSSTVSQMGIMPKLSLRIKEYRYQQKVNKILAGHKRNLEVFSLPDTPYDLSILPAVQVADVLVLHWVAGFVDYRKFFKNITKPVVWMMHDMFPFTGGCHYAGSCNLYQKQCEVCPLLIGTANPSHTHGAWQYKQKGLGHFENLHIAAPSKWLLECSQQSSLFGGRPHHHIPYSVDEDIFKPINPQLAREVLNLPSDKKIILFVAENVSNERKGFAILKEALQHLPQNNDWLVCTIGNPISGMAHMPQIKQLGTVRDELLLGLVYSAADAFVIPSVEDNLPNTVIEALMCGTPAIGFSIGGVKEMIVHGQNGYLCKDISVASLAGAINKLLAEPQAFQREAIAANAKSKYARSVQAQNFSAILRQLAHNPTINSNG